MVTDIVLVAAKLLFSDLTLKPFSAIYLLMKYNLPFYPRLTAFIRAINFLKTVDFLASGFSHYLHTKLEQSLFIVLPSFNHM